MEKLTPEQKEAMLNWLKSSNGDWFWEQLEEWLDGYKRDSVRTQPMKNEGYDFFQFNKAVSSGRACLCQDILALREDLLDKVSQF